MRRFLIALATAAVAAVTALALLPWWLGAALALITPSFGLKFKAYARVGYARFRIEGVEIARPTTLIHIDRVELDTPVVWLWHRWTGHPSETLAGAWRAQVVPRKTPAPKKPVGWMPLRHQLAHTGDVLDRWLPRARTGPGEVVWNRGRLTFGPATWENRTLVASEVDYLRLKTTMTVAVPANDEIRLTLHTLDGAGALALRTESNAVLGRLTWWEQPAELSAHFPEVGWRPTDAVLKAEHWDIPGGRMHLQHLYTRVRGDGHIDWRDSRLTADLAATGEPVAGTPAPPLSVRAHAHGEKGIIVTDVLDATLPGLTAKLAQPVTIDLHGKLRGSGSRFTFTADLAKLPWFSGEGTAQGQGAIVAGRNGYAAVDFSAAADHLAVAKLALAHAEAAGHFEWPRVDISSAKFATPDGAALTGHGAWDIHAHEVRDGAISGQLTYPALARWLPKLPPFARADVTAHFSGPWLQLAHEGQLQADALHVGKLKPFALTATWRGRGRIVQSFDATAAIDATKLLAHGSVGATHVAITAAELTDHGAPQLKLIHPVSFRWQPQWDLDELQLEGPQMMVHAKLAARASDISVRNLSSEWLREFVDLPATKWTVGSAEVHGSWQHGPALFSADGDVSIELGPNRSAQITVHASGDEHGLAISTLHVAEGTTPILNASGRLPLVVRPHQNPVADFNEEAPLTVEAQTTPNPDFWLKLTDIIGVQIVDPEVTAHLSGSWVQPRGDARLRAARVAPLPGRFKFAWPTIEALDIRLAGDRGGLQLVDSSVTVEGQKVRASGSLPVAAVRWEEFIHRPRMLAQRGEFHLEIPDAELAAVARFFPGYLAPKGRVHIEASYRPDTGMTGALRLRDAASRPLGPLGVLQDVDADIRFKGRTMFLENVSAHMGGQPVTLHGEADLPDNVHQTPRMDIALKGENLPFVRRMGLLLRGDLDLKLTAAEGKQASLTGTVRLRDSLFLSDVRSLIPSGTKTGEIQAPYFSIAQPPFRNWRVDVAVVGERFMRIDTTVFGGTASAHFKLSGTLGEPHALGEATIEQGTVRLPFASFEVKQGQVQLTPEHPTEPQLWVSGTARRYGYDLRMEITGPISAPNMTFTSSPPLDAEQVVLMVMAGQAPHNEIATTDRQRATRFGAYFGQSLLGSLGAGSGADRLTISSGENVSEQGHETYNIEYKLSNRWALTGEYDEFDEYYGGVKWRVYPKKEKNDTH